MKAMSCVMKRVEGVLCWNKVLDPFGKQAVGIAMEEV